MAGHSHSANIARRKNAVDAKRGKDFSKLARAIISAARQGGGDPDQNLKLKYAIEKAKAGNMPKDTIERAVAKGSGTLDADAYEELNYEGYAPGGIAVMVCCLTDNRNRTAPDVKNVFEKRGGNLGAPGSVAYMFDQRAVFVVERGERDEDGLTEVALEVGADDVEVEDDVAVFYADAKEFIDVKAALEGQGLEFLSAELAYVPQNRVAIESKDDAGKILRLIGNLDELEDVQNVYANYDMPGEWIDELSS
jgi:YebC/PmpR family DNA-binding regulatory protein